jgi:hypothetical protein
MGMYDFKWGYQLEPIETEEKSDLVTYSPSILGRWRKYFSQLLNYMGK